MIIATSSCLTREQASELIDRWGGRCAYCGDRVYRSMNMEHIEPLSRGGADEPENIVPACLTCNVSKGELFLLEWVFNAYGLLRFNRRLGQFRIPTPPARRRHWLAAPWRSVVRRREPDSIYEHTKELLSCGHEYTTRYVPQCKREDELALWYEPEATARRCYACIDDPRPPRTSAESAVPSSPEG